MSDRKYCITVYDRGGRKQSKLKCGYTREDAMHDAKISSHRAGGKAVPVWHRVAGSKLKLSIIAMCARSSCSVEGLAGSAKRRRRKAKRK